MKNILIKRDKEKYQVANKNAMCPLKLEKKKILFLNYIFICVYIMYSVYIVR